VVADVSRRRKRMRRKGRRRRGRSWCDSVSETIRRKRR